CQAGTPLDPNDGVSCTVDSCDPVTGVANVPNDGLCDDSDVCTGTETCDAVLDCQAGTPLDPNDGVGCTVDSCHPVSGVTNVPNDANCDDADVCTGVETCDAVLDCQAGTPLDPDDGVACTDDSCDAVSGVANVPNDANCDDADVCTADSCDALLGCANEPIIGCSIGFTAYNDCVYDPSLDAAGTDPSGQSVHYTSPNVTTWGIGNVSGDYTGTTYTSGSLYPDTSGLLVDYDGGSSTGVTAIFTQNTGVSSVIWQPQVAPSWTGGYDSASGTDAHDTFNGVADMTGVSYYGGSGWWIDLTLTGLDPAKLYTFATTASRAEANTDGAPGYDYRVTIYTLSGADAATNTSTPGVTVITPTQVSFSTGNNHAEGYVARWTDIAPGADGEIVIRAEPDLTTGSAGNEHKAYTFDVFKLEEIGGEGP
ncbi:MAG: hypothetical protein JRS35_04780, partial [Deltaproteobacteria bacterium]|nr:hypothetical protein [Deltaproteobacteria bacterium]